MENDSIPLKEYFNEKFDTITQSINLLVSRGELTSEISRLSQQENADHKSSVENFRELRKDIESMKDNAWKTATLASTIVGIIASVVISIIQIMFH